MVLASARPGLASGALFRDEHDRILLVQPSYKPHWDIPGGIVEPGESPLDACVREVEEELALRPPIGPLLVVDWAPHPVEGDKVLFIFDGGVLPARDRARIELDPAELIGYGFHDPARIEGLVIPRLFRRIQAALAARRTGRPAYIEHGVAPTWPSTS